MIEECCKYKYSISPKVRLRLSFVICHRNYELTKKDFFNELTNSLIKLSYHWFNKQEILQKAKEKFLKKKLLSIMHKTKKL